MRVSWSHRVSALGPPLVSGGKPMLRNTVRSVLGLVLVAAATWLANYIVEKVFGPEDLEIRA